MNVVMRLLVGSLFLLVASPIVRAYDHPDPTAEDPYEFAIRDHAMFLNELSNRRRLNTFFPNEQSVFYGVPVRYVNSSRGNLTFVRRDLVIMGRIPIVIGRIYDSTIRTDTGFGPGWRLSLAETIEARPNGEFVYVDDSGSEIPLVQRSGAYFVRDPGPSDIASIDIGSDRARIVLRNGWTKVFRLNGERLALAEVRDAYGNTLSIQYRGSRLARIETQNGRFVSVQWNASGRIGRVVDDQDRAVSYVYDERGLLRAVADIGANQWQYEYDESMRLSAATDPQGIPLLAISSDSSNRAVAVEVLGERYQYRYDQGRTTIRDQANRTTFIRHNRYGIATSVTGPTGFVSEVRLDELNRVTSLIHNYAPRATISYGPNGRPETLTSYWDSEQTSYVYAYDASNRPTSVTGSDGSNLALAYNAAGDLLRKQVGTHWTEYEYTAEGDLQAVTNNYGATTYAHNADGQVETIANIGSNTSLTYFPSGKLQSIAFPDGSLHDYRYNVIGLRESVNRGSDFDIEYQYDAAGNLNRSIGFDASGRQIGQSFELDRAYRARVVRHDAGDITKATYDRSGNPETLANSEDPAMPRYSYTYDESNRLLAVADGDTIIGSYVYSGTEPDLRDQLDHHTMRIGANAVRQSTTFGNLHSIAYTRPYGTYLQVVRFNEATSSFDLSGENGVILPDAVRLNSLARQELLKLDGGIQARIDFDRPSNATFLPPEYATINCAQGCVFNGIIVKANGVQGSITVPVGSSVNLTAHKVGVNSCDLLICSWYKNGVWAGFGTPSAWQHTFTSAGAFDMLGACECSPCDFFDYQSVMVNVTCTATVSIASPPHNPSPTDSAWATNYSFLSTSTIAGNATTSPSGAASGVLWTLTPTIGTVQNVSPSNRLGPSISFNPNVTHPPYTPGAGSTAASPPLSYALKANRCSSNDTNTVTQDVRDTIRQEYVNHGISVPSRSGFTSVVGSLHFSASEISQSAYAVMVGDPGLIGEAVRTEYNQQLRTALGNPNFPDQGLNMSSGWRNPERNENVFGVVSSIHQYGNAADLQILTSTVTASGLTSAQLWTILAAAGDAVGTAFCENGPSQVACTNAVVTHVHTQN